MKKLEVTVADKFSVKISDYQTELRQNWHSHEEFILAMLLRGNVREQVKCEDTLINALDIGMKAPDVRHTDYFCPEGVRVIRLSLAPKFVEELKKESLLNEGWYWIKQSRAVRPFLQIGQSFWSKSFDIEESVYELLASLLSTQDKTKKSHPPFWLRRAKQQLEETFSEGVSFNQLAVEAGVHPVYFSRQFHYFFGCSASNYVRQLQFQKAHNLLISGKFNLAQIALETGFSDQSHLTRIFVNEFGITPAKFRKLLK